MTESELLVALARVKAKRAACERYTEEWAELGYEMSRLSEQIRAVRRGGK